MKRPGAKESSAKSLSFSPAHYEWSVNEEGHARMANKAAVSFSAVAFEWQRFLVRDSGGGERERKSGQRRPLGPMPPRCCWPPVCCRRMRPRPPGVRPGAHRRNRGSGSQGDSRRGWGGPALGGQEGCWLDKEMGRGDPWGIQGSRIQRNSSEGWEGVQPGAAKKAGKQRGTCHGNRRSGSLCLAGFIHNVLVYLG